ncbi:gasdermin-E-like [Acanthopagrus latus]|uniref:gasdermin-E-like n=1 Tax=Acanthopagrus latus TaxID=8177 RepID=UPI00187BFA1B|nr:gasdermin-E-like [Acanthopagrus latus]XP_036947871.1 gasdermin-E-like [Acanthopagrus latus]
MFSKATAKFIHEIDHDGSLIHVSRINDSHKLVLMALVVKRNCNWFWQKPKYQPTDFTLSHLLQGDEVLVPGVSEKDFVTYKGTYGDALSGKLDTEAGAVNLTLEGQGSTKLQSCFGTLKKEELDLNKLLRDSKGRQVDMQHKLVKQLQKRAELLAVVKERIFTTSSCTISLRKKEQCSFGGMLALKNFLGNSVCVKDSNNIEVDSNVSLEIPSGTVIAYSVRELEINKDGSFDVCLQPGTTGGIESDSTILPMPSHESLDVMDGKCNGKKSPETVSHSVAHNGSQKTDLSLLAELSQPTRHALFKELQETLKDRTALSYLQCVLEDMCFGETLVWQEELSESQRKPVLATVNHLCSGGPAEDNPSDTPAHISAAHLLVSAMEELPDETLNLLSGSCPDFLETFDTLVCSLTDSSEPVQCPAVLLQDSRVLQQAEQVLTSIDVKLTRDGDRLWMTTECTTGVPSLVLRLSVHGLSLLSKGLTK